MTRPTPSPVTTAIITGVATGWRLLIASGVLTLIAAVWGWSR